MRLSRYIERHIKWLFPLPAGLFVIAMIVFPIAYTFYVSLTNWSMSSGGPISFVGLDNYLEMFREPRFLLSILRTFYFTALAVGVETVLGVAIALILNHEFAGKNLAKLILLLPMVATPVAIALAWTLFYEPTIGLGNYTLRLLGLPASKWLASNLAVIPSLVAVDIWEWTPMIALIVLAGLAGLPTEPMEAAVVDGAKPFQRLRYITLPLLGPTIWVALALRSIDALKTFDLIYVMTAGGPGFASETMNIYAYSLSFGYFRFGAASSVLIVLFAVVLACSILVLRLRKVNEF